MPAASGHEEERDPPFEIRERAVEGATVVALEGDLDIVTAQHASDVLSSAQSDAATVVLDLRELRFIDSSGLRVVLEAQRRAATEDGSRLLVAPGDAGVRRVFDLSGVGGLLEIVDAPPRELEP